MSLNQGILEVQAVLRLHSSLTTWLSKFLITRLFFQSLKKQSKQRTPCTKLLLKKFRAKAKTRATLHGSPGQGYCLPKELVVYVDWSIHEKLSGLNFGRYFLTEFSSPAVENSPQLCVTIRIIRSGGLASLFFCVARQNQFYE